MKKKNLNTCKKYIPCMTCKLVLKNHRKDVIFLDNFIYVAKKNEIFTPIRSWKTKMKSIKIMVGDKTKEKSISCTNKEKTCTKFSKSKKLDHIKLSETK